jgi:hypothetical protein
LFLWVNLMEKWSWDIFFQLQMRNVRVKSMFFRVWMRTLFNYEWEMCGWRVLLSLSILIRKMSWKAKLWAKTLKLSSMFCFPMHLICKDVFKIGFYPTLEDGTILSNFHCFNMNANMRRFKQLCSSNMLSTIDLLVWEPLKKRKQSCHMHFIFKLLHQCSNWNKEIYMKLDNWNDLNNWYL